MIYKITNTVTGDFYIGFTSKTLEERFKKHLANAKSGSNTYLYKAIRKYGEQSFQIEILQEEGSLNEDEPLWIKTLKPSYNMTSGGDGGDTSQSPAYKEGMKHRSMAGKNNPQYGKFGADNPKSIAVIVDGVKYDSITLARKGCKKSFTYVKKNGILVK